YVRRRALASTASEARLAPTVRVRRASTAAMATVMVLVAVTGADIGTGPVAAETPRDVARSVIDPRVVVDSSVAPLAAYRNFFSDTAFDEPLFTVKVTKGDVS